jgi:uncharacterized membrane protein
VNRTIWHRIAWALGVLAIVSGLVFALMGTHPGWMMATFWFTLGTIVSTALAVTSP